MHMANSQKDYLHHYHHSNIFQQQDMIHPRLIVPILFVVSFFAYYLYIYNTAMIRIWNNRDGRDGRAYNPLVPIKHFHRSSNFFDWQTHHGYCERTVSSERNIIRTQIYSIHSRVPHYDPSTIIARQDMPPVIIPPLPTTGCESMNGNAKTLCEIDFERIITIAACVGIGLVVVPALLFIAWTLERWIRAVRPKKKTIMIGKEAKMKAAEPTGRGLWWKSGGQIQEYFPDMEAYIYGRNAAGARVERARTRLEEKEVWYGGVRMTMPWGRDQNWDRAVSWYCKVSAGEN